MSKIDELFDQIEKQESEETEVNQSDGREDKIDTVTFDVPAIMRICELMREAEMSDSDLHVIVDRLIKTSKEKGVITMSDYESIYQGVIDKESAGDGDSYKESEEVEDKEDNSVEESMSVSKILNKIRFI